MLETLIIARANAVRTTAATASASDDWKWLVPMVTLIVGFGLK